MVCSFDNNFFDYNWFDVCFPYTYASVEGPFLLRKIAKGFVKEYPIIGNLLRLQKKSIGVKLRLKRSIIYKYPVGGALTKKFYDDFKLSGTSKFKKEVSFNIDKKTLEGDDAVRRFVKMMAFLETLEDF
jgi:hypothetical protein